MVNLRKPARTDRALLLADSIINLLLGVLLLLYPGTLVRMLGLPEVRSAFYPSVLGGVLFGIGIALAVAYRGGAQGLGLDGAVAINLCGACTVIAWLVAAPQQFSPAGRLTLLAVALLVLGIGCVEGVHRLRQREP